MNNEIDFELVRRANIATAHFAKICGVSRVTATLWLNGTSTPRGLYRERVVQRLKLIHNALEKGYLPLPRVSRADRFKAVISALRRP